MAVRHVRRVLAVEGAHFSSTLALTSAHLSVAIDLGERNVYGFRHHQIYERSSHGIIVSHPIAFLEEKLPSHFQLEKNFHAGKIFDVKYLPSPITHFLDYHPSDFGIVSL